MKLKSGVSFWQAVNPHALDAPRLRRNVSCEVAIVGSGIVGALLAYHLCAEGVSTVVVDKRAVAVGSTSASTALLLYELDVHLTDLSRMLGARRAARVYALSLQSIETLSRLTKTLGIGDSFRRKRSLYVSFARRDVAALGAEHALRRRQGFRCELLDRSTLRARFGLDAHAAILSQDAAEVDPFRLTQALLRRAIACGARVYAGTEVLRVGERAHDSILETPEHVIRARHVVMATGYESQRGIGKTVVRLKSSYVIVSAPVPGLRGHWLHEHLLWETKRPYVYVRTTQDDRIIVGGADAAVIDDVGRDRLLPRKSRVLRARFESLFPTIPFQTACAWAGTFGETPDGMGYLGIPAGWSRTRFVLGFGGNGITFAATASAIVAAQLRGRPPRDAALFRFDR